MRTKTGGYGIRPTTCQNHLCKQNLCICRGRRPRRPRKNYIVCTNNIIRFLTTSSVSAAKIDIYDYLYSGVPPVSLRLGHGSALELHRSSIHSLAAASLPTGEGFYLCELHPISQGGGSSPAEKVMKFMRTKTLYLQGSASSTTQEKLYCLHQ